MGQSNCLIKDPCQVSKKIYSVSYDYILLVIAERCARSSTSIATWTSPPSSCEMQGGTGASCQPPQQIYYIVPDSCKWKFYRNQLYLWVSFCSNSTKCSINNVNKGRCFQILFSSITNEKLTTNTVHSKLSLHLPFAAGNKPNIRKKTFSNPNPNLVLKS